METDDDPDPGCGFSPNPDNNPGGCVSFINDMNNLGKYYFGREQGRNMIGTRDCGACTNDWDDKYNKSTTCNDNAKFGSRFPNRIKTGLRYIIECESNDEKALIVGYEFFCLNYDGWHTVAVFAHFIDPNRYDWTPWFICQKGQKAEIVGTFNITECQTLYFVPGINDCHQRNLWCSEANAVIQVQCVDVSSGSSSAKIWGGELMMIDGPSLSNTAGKQKNTLELIVIHLKYIYWKQLLFYLLLLHLSDLEYIFS